MTDNYPGLEREELSESQDFVSRKRWVVISYWISSLRTIILAPDSPDRIAADLHPPIVSSKSHNLAGANEMFQVRCLYNSGTVIDVDHLDIP